jgi:uncharacterized protein YciI
VSYFILRYESVVDDYVNRRAPFRADHLRLVRDAHARGEIVMAGAVGDPPEGAVLIFKAASPGVAEQFAANDPYVRNGLVLSWRVQPWNVVVGAED